MFRRLDVLAVLTATPEIRALRRACPCCGSLRAQRVFEQRFARIEGVSIHGGYDVVTCIACGFCFAHGVPSQPAFDRYYREASKYEGHGPSSTVPEHTVQRFREEITDLLPHIPSRDAAILEVGCATGALLALLKEHGYTNLHGLDPSPACAQSARQLYDLTVDTGDLADGIPGQHDVIVLMNVLEHVRALDRAVRMLRASLKPGGLLFVEVPDALRFGTLIEAPFQEFSTEHINYFSTETLGALMNRHGFSTVWQAAPLRSDAKHHQAPAVSGIFRRVGAAMPTETQRPTNTAAALRAYVSQCRQQERSLNEFVHSLVVSRTPLLVWGCGTLTLRLLASGDLARANIVGFVDGNARYWGRTILGIPIVAPDDVRDGDEPILVSSYGQVPAIAARVAQRFPRGRKILVYPDAST